MKPGGGDGTCSGTLRWCFGPPLVYAESISTGARLLEEIAVLSGRTSINPDDGIDSVQIPFWTFSLSTMEVHNS